MQFVLTLASIFGLAAIVITGIFFNRHFFYVLFLTKPFIDMTVNETVVGDLNALVLSGAFICIIVFIKYLNKPPSMPVYNEGLIWTFILLQIITFFFAFTTGNKGLFVGVKVFIKLISAYVIYFVAAIEIMQDMQKRNKFFKLIWITTLIAGVITVLIFVLGVSNTDTTKGIVRYNGLYNDPGTPSYLSIVCLLFANLYYETSKEKRNLFYNILYYGTFTVTAILLVITITKSALIMFVLYILLWYGIYKRKLFLIAPTMIISIALSFSMSDDLNTRFANEKNYVDSGGDADAARSVGTGRVNRWETLFDIYFNEYTLMNQLVGSAKNYMAHNQYIAYLMQVGIIGLSIFLLFIFRFVNKLYSIYRLTKNPTVFAALSLLLVYMVYGLTGHPFDYTTLLWYLMILLAIINVYDKSLTEKKYKLNAELLKRNNPNDSASTINLQNQ